MGWVIRVEDDLEAIERRLDRHAVDGNRRLPDGREFLWKQIGIKGTMADPQLPFFVRWADGSPHPSHEAETAVTISSLMIAGDPDRVRDWLGSPVQAASEAISVDFVAPHGTPGLLSVTFNTPGGQVTL